jgi:hypothetical protein
MTLVLTKNMVELLLEEHKIAIRKWVFDGIDLAANSESFLFYVLTQCDHETLTKCLKSAGLLSVATHEGVKFDYYTMLKRNIEFVAMLKYRKSHFSTYLAYHSRDIVGVHEVVGMQNCMKTNNSNERRTLAKLYPWIRENDDSSSSSSDESVPDLVEQDGLRDSE